MKVIVTHVNPDEDALCSIWLVKRFLPQWEDAKVEFVPAGKTLGLKPSDDDENIIHLDTGLGKFDHHQTGDRNKCAASLVLDEILRQKLLTDQTDIEALKNMIAVVLDVDHAGEKNWPDPLNDRYEFFLESILGGLKTDKRQYPNEVLVSFALIAFDGIFQRLKQKISALDEIKTGIEFESPWGQGIALEAANDAVLDVGERLGYMIVIKKDPIRGNIRIYAHPSSGADLTRVYDQVLKLDPQSDWFLHATKHLLLNGSSKNTGMKPSRLALQDIIRVVSSLEPKNK